MCDDKNLFELVYIKNYKKFIDLFENNQEYQDVYNKIKNFLLREIEIKYIGCIGYCDDRRR